MSSMRYVRGRGKNTEEKARGRGGPPADRNQRWTSPEARGRGRGGVCGSLSASRGRSNYSFARGTSSNKHNQTTGKANKWVRQSDDDTDGRPAAQTDADDAKIEGNKPISSLERRGKHKLVMKRDSSEIALDETGDAKGDGDIILGVGTKSTEDQKIAMKSGDRSETEQTEIKQSSSGGMERRGFGKLVLKRADSKDGSSGARSKIATSGNTWKRQSSKSSNLMMGDKKDNGNNTTAKQNSRQNTRHIAGSKRKHAEHPTEPRRISLMKSSMSEKQLKDDGGQNCALVTNAAPSAAGLKPAPSSEKTLTDFCYQNTGGRGRGSGRRGRGGGRGSSVRGGKVGGNVGLVRVKPENTSSTPICPTFRRGLPCKNPKCRLRHDIATEASRPICVFFQRNGMCTKDDCPFRHVKVPWDAEICPAFGKMGYCEDPDCLLRHVVTKKPRVESTSVDEHSPTK